MGFTLVTMTCTRAPSDSRRLLDPAHPGAATRLHDVFVIAQVVDVQQAVGADRRELHERAELDHGRDETFERLADAIAQVYALEPRVHVAIGFVGAFLELRELGARERELPAVVSQAIRIRIRQHRAQAAMHDEVGIAADRRGEMRVVLERETEVPDVLRLIHRLHHRANDQRLDERPLFVVTEPVGDGAEIPRAHVVREFRRDCRAR